MTTYDIVHQAIDQNIDARPLMLATDEREWKVDVLAARVTEALTRKGGPLSFENYAEAQSEVARETCQIIFDMLGKSLGRTHLKIAEELTAALQEKRLLVYRPTPSGSGERHRSVWNDQAMHPGPAAECQLCRDLAKLPPRGRN